MIAATIFESPSEFAVKRGFSSLYFLSLDQRKEKDGALRSHEAVAAELVVIYCCPMVKHLP